MGVETFFFDSYAFFEIAEGNPNYERFTKNIAIVTTRLNLMELFYGLLIKYDKQIANHFYDALVQFCVDIDDAVIKEAVLFRALNRRRHLSYVDCIGYVLAQQRHIPFLTGDEQFKSMENVVFVP